MIKAVRADMEEFELTRVVRAIQDFVIDDLSNWYVRRTRERFWASEMNNSKKAVYRTLWEALIAVAKLMAPFAPFLAEEIYRNLTQGSGLPSVHFEKYPEFEAGFIDAKLEEHMGLVIDLVSLGRAARNKVQIKVRQPLSELLIDQRNQKILAPVEGLVKEELNIKKINYVANPDEYVAYTVKPNFPVLGPKYGKIMKGIGTELAAQDAATLVKTLRSAGSITLTVEGTTVTLTDADLEVRVEEKSGFVVEMSRSNFCILNTALTPELIEEGLAREMVSKVQNMRKSAGFELTDRIELEFVADDEVTQAVEHFKNYVSEETLAVSVNRSTAKDEGFESWDLNGHPAELRVRKI
ncbi:MAG TPA: DUF5915 domain-containing protein [Bacillota bacterium]|nr:DUF5915 domain-containing protein [Bacillota bacterium]